MAEPRAYIIGDVHGEDARLESLHEAVLAHHLAAGGPAVLVHLGDLIDRGPDSRGVVERVMRLQSAPPPMLDIFCLRGNHEQMLLDALASDDPEDIDFWRRNGGDETLASYERALKSGAEGRGTDWRACIDEAHRDWLEALPYFWEHPAQGWLCVHAGIDPATWPRCDAEILLWTRSERFFDPRRWPKRRELAGLFVIHGHTPTQDFMPDLRGQRLNIDTGAVYGGPLTCAVLQANAPVSFLEARRLSARS